VDISNRIVWQQGSGDTDRDYAALCLNWDVILNGPGRAGQWPDCANDLLRAGYSARKVTDLRRFCEDVKDGHLVVLRRGTATILGVGQIVGGTSGGMISAMSMDGVCNTCAG
jgi:hypothetical protein